MRLQETHKLSKQQANGWPRGTLTLSLLGSSLRPRTVPINQRSSKAVRRMRTTLRQHGTLGMRGVPDGSHALHRLGLPSCKANHAVSRWRRKPCPHVPIPPFHLSSVGALSVRVVVVLLHTTKSVTRGVLSTFVPAWGCYR